MPSCAGPLDGQSGAFVRCTKSAREEFPMIGLVLVTHGRLADEFRAALEHVMGPQNKLQPLRLEPRTTPNCVEVISSKR